MRSFLLACAALLLIANCLIEVKEKNWFRATNRHFHVISLLDNSLACHWTVHEPHTYNIWLIIFLFVATYCFHSRDKHIKVKTERKKNRFSYEYLINHLLCSLRIVLRKCRIRLLFYDKSLIWDSAMRPPPWRVTILKRKRLYPFALTNSQRSKRQLY